MVAVSRAALVDAAKNLNQALGLDPEIDVKLGAGELREQVVEAAMVLNEEKDFDKISAITRGVVSAMRDQIIAAVPKMREALVSAMRKDGKSDAEIAAEAGESEESMVARVTATMDVLDALPKETPPAATAESKSATAKKSNKHKLDKFESVRPDSGLFSKILAAHLGGQAGTVAAAASAVGVDDAKVVAALRRARITNGIDHEVGEDGSLSVILPKGVTADSVWRQPKTRPATTGGPRKVVRSKYTIDPEDIAAGRLPKGAPVVTSAANEKQYQPKFDKLHELAKSGDWKGVHDYKVTGSNNYSKLLERYRGDLLALHSAARTAAA
jgi:hypothetical protein